MKPRNRKDFERLIRRFCRERKLELRERQPGTSHRSFSIRNQDGRVIATIIIVGGTKEISSGTLRGILRALTDQLARHTADDLHRILKLLIAEFTKWLQQ